MSGIDGNAAPDHPLVDVIVALFLRPGAVPAQHDDIEFHRQRIRWEWRSNQWCMEVGPDNKLWGWVAYYRCDSAILADIAKLQLDAFMDGDPWAQLTQGPHCYMSTAVVAPWAPNDTLTHIARAVRARNLDAETQSWHHRYPDGRSRFVKFPMALEV